MRIAFYVNTIGNGGAERVIVNLANMFSKRDYQVYMITTQVNNHFEYELDNKVDRIVLEKNIISSRILKNISRIVTLRKVLKRNKIDVLVSFLAQPNFRSILATRFLKTKTIISIRNDPNVEYSGTSAKILAKVLFPLTDGCIFQTNDAKRWFSKRLQNKSKIIPNQVDQNFFITPRISEDYYVAAGRLTQQKNYPLMINAFTDFVKKYPDEKLCIYGSGELESELNDLIIKNDMKNNIFLMGQSGDMPKVYSRAKAFLMTSDYEGLPNAMLEAMAVGIPVIVTDCPCGGPRMYIKSMENGILISTNNHDELLNALNKVQSDNEFKNKISALGKQTSDLFKPAAVFEQWEQYIQSIQKG